MNFVFYFWSSVKCISFVVGNVYVLVMTGAKQREKQVKTNGIIKDDADDKVVLYKSIRWKVEEGKTSVKE